MQGASRKPVVASVRHIRRPAARASRSARRRRKLPGSTSTFCSSPALIIRQRVARLTPKNFAEADIPKSNGPCVTEGVSVIRRSRIASIAANCSGDASNSFFSRSSVFMASPPGLFAGFRRDDCVRHDDGFLNHASENTTVKCEISSGADVELCWRYPVASAFGYACGKISLFCWTRFSMAPDSVAQSEMPAREVVEARPVAQRAQSMVDRSKARRTLTARREPYNRPAPLHAQSMTDRASSCDHR